VNFYHDLVEQTDIQPELPDIYKPSEDAEHGGNELYDIRLPWDSKKLFHLYILAYSQDKYNICDLIADTWIWAFQKMDVDPRTRVWRGNVTDYKPREEIEGPCDHFTTLIDRHITSFDFKLLRELYDNTGRDCGARLLWADALALCAAWLELKMDARTPDMRKWHPELMWDVLRTSLRMSGVRLTLKIEEKNHQAWCERYHEHTKHSAECYRKLAEEQQVAVKEREEDRTDIDGGDAGEVDAEHADLE
jgi:hypothetical protein